LEVKIKLAGSKKVKNPERIPHSLRATFERSEGRKLQPIEVACQEKNLSPSPNKGALVCCKPAERAISSPHLLTRVLHGMVTDAMICTIQPNGLCMGASQ